MPDLTVITSPFLTEIVTLEVVTPSVLTPFTVKFEMSLLELIVNWHVAVFSENVIVASELGDGAATATTAPTVSIARVAMTAMIPLI